MADTATVPVVAPDGTPGTVPAAEVREVVASGGRVMAPAEAKATKEQIDFETKYDGTVEGAVMPGLAGAARGLTLGGSDVALSKLPGVGRKLLDYQRYAPVASGVGEFGAIAGAALLGDEAGIGRLPGLVGKLGASVGEGTAEALGGGLFARGAGTLARGAAEGAIYATGKAAGDAAIRDDDLTAEQAIAAAGHGALFGAGANALFAGAGKALESVGGLRAPRVGVGSAAEAEAGSLRGTLGDKLEKTADVKTIKALGGSAGDLRTLEASTPGGFRRVAQDIRSDVESTTGKSIGLHNKESLHAYATERVEELGDKLGGMLKKLDDSGAGIAPDVKAFAAKARAELVEPNLIQTPSGPVILPGKEDTVHAVEAWLGKTEAAFGERPPTFSEWQRSRVGLQEKINFAQANKSPEQQALIKLRGIMEGELEASGEAAAKNVGSAFADEYRATKSLYQSVRKAEELTERGVAAELARNSYGLGATIGAATGLATGGPITGLAMGLAGKIIKDRGDQMAADLLSRAANLVGVQRLASQTSARIASGAAKLTGTAPITAGVETLPGPVRSVAAPLGVVLSGSPRNDFKKISEAVTTATASPAHTIDKVAQALGPGAGHNPALTMAATGTILKGVSFLQSKLPPTRADQFSLQPQLQKESRASDAEVSKFMRYAEAVDNPTMVLAEAKNGTLTRDHVEAVKAVYPKLYDQMRQQVMQQLTTSKSPLPYGARIQLGILLDIPTDRTLAPDFQQAIQATYSSAEQAGAETPPPQLSRPLAIASAQATPLVGAMSEGLEK